MTKPPPNLPWFTLVAIAAILATMGAARADIVDEATVACKTKSTVAQIDQLLSDKDKRGYRKLVDAKTKIGDCRPLKARTDVKIDKREGDLACVKAKGDAKCSWVLETALRITSQHRQPVRQDYFACKSPLYLDAGRKIFAENDQEAIKRFRFATSQSGECLTLKKGEQVDVERGKDKIFCIRPPSEDQCYWTDSLALPANILEERAGSTPGPAISRRSVKKK